MADKGYQEGWAADRVALPDTASDWSLRKAFREYANRVTPDVTAENSALNMFLDKQTMADIDWSGAGGRAHAGAGMYTGLQPYPPDPRAPIQGGNASVPQSDTHAKPGWVRLPQPGEMEAGEHGSGYYTYGTTPGGRPGSDYQWGTPQAMEVIGSVADRLATGGQYTPFGVGNISLSDGAKTRDHKGHQRGSEIDVRPARVDAGHSGVSYKDPQYDSEATQRLVEAFRATGQVGTILFNDPALISKGLVRPASKHDDHLHIKLKE